MMQKRVPFFSVVGVLVAAALITHIKVNRDRQALEFVHTGDQATTRTLIDSGADINQSGEMGSTPLMQAARSGDVEAVKALLSNKAALEAVDQSGRTAMHWALYMYRISKAAQYTGVCKALLDGGAKIDFRDRQKRTYLMNAIDAGNLEIAESLIDRGIDVKATDVSGTTALMCAMRGALTGKQTTTLCKELLAKGVDPNAKDRGGKTAYDMAAHQKDAETRDAGMKALGPVTRH